MMTSTRSSATTTSRPQAASNARCESIASSGEIPGALARELPIAGRDATGRPPAAASLKSLVADGPLTASAHHPAQFSPLGRNDVRGRLLLRYDHDHGAGPSSSAARAAAPPAVLPAPPNVEEVHR